MQCETPIPFPVPWATIRVRISREYDLRSNISPFMEFSCEFIFGYFMALLWLCLLLEGGRVYPGYGACHNRAAAGGWMGLTQ